MSFKRTVLTLSGKLWLIAAIALIIVILYLLLFCPPPTHAITTTRVELKEVGGSADGKVVLTRIANDTFQLQTDGSTIIVKDGNITMTGKIITGQSSELANLLFLNYTIRSPDGTFNLQAYSNMNFQVDYDNDESNSFFFKDGLGNDIATIQEDGDATFIGGVNVGTNTGATAGDIRMSRYLYCQNQSRIFPDGSLVSYLQIRLNAGYIDLYSPTNALRILTTGTDNIYFNNGDGGDVIFHQNNLSRNFISWANNTYVKGGLNVGTETGASVGEIETTTLLVSSSGHLSNIFFALNQLYSSSDSPLYLKADTDVVLRPDSDNDGTNAIIFQAGDATQVGSVDESGNAQFDANVSSLTSQLDIQTASPPAASSTYSGMLWHLEDVGDSDRGKLYICLRTAGTTNYSWVLIAQGL